MPEAIIIAVDTSDYMRNGDYFPSRLMATQEAAVLLFNNFSNNPESQMGLVTMAGKAVAVRETLTTNVDRLMGATTQLTPGGDLKFSTALQVSALALTHCLSPQAHKRVVVFVGSPITETPTALEKLAKRLKKEAVAVDVVSFGVESNVPLLQNFVSIADRGNNGPSRLFNVPREMSITDAIMQLIAADAGGSGADAGGMGGMASMGGGAAVDPNMDPELAMVLRMSLEDERRRQEAAAAAAAGGGAPPVAPAPAHGGGEVFVDEEEELRRAIELSMAEERAAQQGGASSQGTGAAPASSSGASSRPAAAPAPSGPAIDAATFDAAFANEDWMRDLARDAGVDPNHPPAPSAGGGGGSQPPPSSGGQGDNKPPPQPPAS